MDNQIQWIPHAQNVELRLAFSGEQTSFTLRPHHPIREKTLVKIRAWLEGKMHPAHLDQLMAELERSAVELKRRILGVTKQAEPQSRVSDAPVQVYCDYSRYGSEAFWACVLLGPQGETQVCGQVPQEQAGEQYAALRALHYLCRTGLPGTIWCDEQNTVNRLSHWFPVQHMPRSHATHRQAHQLVRAFAAACLDQNVQSEWQSLLRQIEPESLPAVELVKRGSSDWSIQIVSACPAELFC